MNDIAPLMSMSAFMLGSIAFLFISRILAELATRKEKSPRNRANDSQGYHNKTLQRYYNTYSNNRKGA